MKGLNMQNEVNTCLSQSLLFEKIHSTDWLKGFYFFVLKLSTQ